MNHTDARSIGKRSTITSTLPGKDAPMKTPRYIRCYDNGGETIDRYTVVYTGNYRRKTSGQYFCVGMSAWPFHPQGFGQYGESRTPIDRPRSRHLGRHIEFEELPVDCQKLVQQDYVELWGEK